MREFRVDGYVSDAVKPVTLRALSRESVAAKNNRKARKDKQQGIADLTPKPEPPKVKGDGLFYLTATALQSSWQKFAEELTQKILADDTADNGRPQTGAALTGGRKIKICRFQI